MTGCVVSDSPLPQTTATDSEISRIGNTYGFRPVLFLIRLTGPENRVRLQKFLSPRSGKRWWAADPSWRSPKKVAEKRNRGSRQKFSKS